MPVVFVVVDVEPILPTTSDVVCFAKAEFPHKIFAITVAPFLTLYPAVSARGSHPLQLGEISTLLSACVVLVKESG